MFSHGFPTPSRFGSDAPKAKLTTAAFAHGIPSSWHHVRQQHGRKPVRGPVRTFLRMLFHDMDTANYTSDSLSDLRPTYSPLPTTPGPRPPSFGGSPSRRQPLPPPPPAPSPALHLSPPPPPPRNPNLPRPFDPSTQSQHQPSSTLATITTTPPASRGTTCPRS